MSDEYVKDILSKMNIQHGSYTMSKKDGSYNIVINDSTFMKLTNPSFKIIHGMEVPKEHELKVCKYLLINKINDDSYSFVEDRLFLIASYKSINSKIVTIEDFQHFFDNPLSIIDDVCRYLEIKSDYKSFIIIN